MRSGIVAVDGALRDVLDRLDSTVVPEERVRERTDAGTLRNANTPGDLLAVERRPNGAEWP